MVVSADDQLSPVVLDEVEDEGHIDDQVGRLMLQVVLLQMSSMEMSTTRLEAHEDLDVQDVEEEGNEMEYCDAEYPSEDEAAGDDGWMVIAPSWGG